MNKIPMQFPYGAVYFRKSNPPKKDWERDYKTAAEDGMNVFRHWFMWGSIEIAPGVFDWDDYDMQMELAYKNNIKVIIAEITTSVPEWVYHKYPHLLCKDKYGNIDKSRMGVSSATGGFYNGLCLDKELARELTGNFLRELANRYKDHPALLGYDVWNECNYSSEYCYCEDTVKQYQEWLKDKYKDIRTLANAWHKYSYTSFDEVMPPAALQLYPECFDWLEFRKENAYKHMKWKIDIIKSIDNKHLIAAHGTGSSVNNMATGGSDDWKAAENVEVYGFTFVACRKGSEPWKHWQAVDITRAGSRGKTFWHAEAQGGPLWLQPQVVGRPREDGRIATPQDIRLWNLTSMAGGARGILYPRWRPLLDGPLFGAFGPYAMNGSRTDRSEMASKVAKWANDPQNAALMSAKPVRGDVGILIVPETQTASLLLSAFGSEDLYSKSVWGAYRGFLDNNIQADFVHIDDIDEYDVVYFPYPIMLKTEHAQKLINWVRNGGTLISEACPAYFGDLGTVGDVQPGLGLTEVFGVNEETVEFMPDIYQNNIEFIFNDNLVTGSGYLQTYELTTAKECSRLADGRIIAALNRYGAGQAVIFGTYPSISYFDTSGDSIKRYFGSVLEFTGKTQRIKTDNDKVIVRMHKSDTRAFIWVVNPSSNIQKVKISIQDENTYGSVLKVYWGSDSAVEVLGDNMFTVIVPSKDALIFGI